MKVYLATLGCRLNEAELASWRRELGGRGHAVVVDPAIADAVVVNSCAVTAEAARKSRKLAARLHRLAPAAPVIMTGCYATLAPERAAALAGVDRVIENGDKGALVAALEQQLGEGPGAPLEVAPAGGRTRAFVKVQDGCRNRCTFCIVTVARGEERSRPIAEVVAEVNGLAAAGVREAVLTGVHLGGYGSDLGTDLVALVEAVCRDSDIERVRLSSLEPWDLPPDFHRLWQHPRLLPHLHLPLQSGCDATLKRMARRCPTGRYAALLERLRENIPDLEVTTDLIVGFPGESENEWAQTTDFVAAMGFADMHVFTYSARQGTAAARMKGRVPVEVARQRSRQMHAIAAASRRRVQERYLGSEREVLWEGPGEGERFTGYTDNYLRVEARVAPGTRLDNRIGPARLVRVEGERLVAEVAEVAGAPSPPRRRRLPVLVG